jgi:GT2 family glycosyltransferase
MRQTGRVTVVIATMNRAGELDADLTRLERLDDVAAIVVVDNASVDDTVARTRSRHPGVEVVPLPRNVGAAARTVGARRATTPYVAFADDDSWWDPGALRAAVAVMEADPAVALVAADVRVEPGSRLDSVSEAQAAGPYDVAWRRRPAGRRAVAGFLACAVVVDRARYLAAGGFDEVLGIGGEEELLALDLAGTGWRLVHAPEAVARHRPSTSRDPRGRSAAIARNGVLGAVLRLPPRTVAGRVGSLVRAAAGGDLPATVVSDTARLAAWAVAQRRSAPADVVGRFAATWSAPV